MPDLSRRTFVRGSLAAGGTGLLSAALPATAQAADVTVTDPAGTVTLAADDATGAIRVHDGGGTHRLTITHFKYSNTARTFNASSVTKLSDTELHVQYVTQHPTVTVKAVVVAGLRKARIRWEVSGAEAVPGQFAIARAVVNGTETYQPVTLWNRDGGGGIPYETTHGVGYAMTYADNRLLLRLRDSTPGFGDATWLHAPGTAAADGGFVTETVLVPGLMRAHSAGVIARDILTPLGIDLWTDQPFHVWNTGGAKTVNAQVVNAEATARQVRVAWTARTWDGAVQSGTTGPATVAARSVWNSSFQVALGGRDIAFVEAVVNDVTNASVTAFARTNVAVLSSSSYQAGDASMFGLANYPWMLTGPAQDDVAALMKLIGMKWVRTAYAGAPGIPPAELDRLGFQHNVQLGDLPIGKPADEQEAWAAARVALCVDAGARYYECDNELNLTEPGLEPEQYVTDALAPLRHAMGDDPAFKVMTCGLAGLDEAWLDKFTEADGWRHVDVLAYHPGRGNYVADYDPPEPWLEPDGRRKPVFWNFIGSLRKAHEVRTVNGRKELWLTEAYASTQPNRWWTDTYRHAAENVLLQLMFAKAYGVRCVTWYTLDDGIEQQPREADPGDVEYHFGLLLRDRSPKPSLLAFATAARFLDQAQYDGRITFSDPEVKGLLFTTPTGRFCVLWTRRDGYVLNDDPARRDPGNPVYYRTPEPWLDPWPTKTPISLPTPAATTTVRELNSIGQETLHTATAGRVTVTLDGAPRIFVGLDLTTTDLYPVN
ncbi:hypothetical protein E1262_18650 [Jiangella aurantiaca]|uniref:Asl1-like glycosyl hydrolase catalytic domain-containing protein n=1 Tax=Jiangella aurantiaca TaxID=2530373 RepID=A0A4R5A7P2_9ACTN|nr:hypothetical protein [Jiangella aurantiaca]TDD67665.1 hypothetical protein E1262_18650 [Jiangella aurantiaca]